VIGKKVTGKKSPAHLLPLAYIIAFSPSQIPRQVKGTKEKGKPVPIYGFPFAFTPS
jgi:hypothetical protein